MSQYTDKTLELALYRYKYDPDTGSITWAVDYYPR